MKKFYNYCINLDWLEVYCTATAATQFKTNNIFEIIEQDYGTQQYNKKADIYYRENAVKELVANVLWEPRLSVMRKESVHIKINNSQLYKDGFFNTLKKIITTYRLQYQGITRVDVCYDCNRFYNGLYPVRLISEYLADKILKIGNNSPIVDYRSMGYLLGINAINVPRSLQKSKKVINAVTWGSRKSGIQVQMYNKSLELKEQKYKPWIIENWRKAGLDENNVWRTEIRIAGKGRDIMDLSTSDMFQVGLTDIMDQDRIDQLLYNYAQKYCRFVKADYHLKKQQMSPIRLLSLEKTQNFKPKFLKTTQEGNRTFKVVSNMIETVSAMLEDGRLKPSSSEPLHILTTSLQALSNYLQENFQEITPYDFKKIKKTAWYKNVINSILYDKDKETLFNQ